MECALHGVLEDYPPPPPLPKKNESIDFISFIGFCNLYKSTYDAPRNTPGYRVVWRHLASARGKIM